MDRIVKPTSSWRRVVFNRTRSLDSVYLHRCLVNSTRSLNQSCPSFLSSVFVQRWVLALLAIVARGFFQQTCLSQNRGF
jgi:hypothetical protein